MNQHHHQDYWLLDRATRLADRAGRWAVVSGSDTLHVMPRAEGHVASAQCWCGPTADDGVMVHHRRALSAADSGAAIITALKRSIPDFALQGLTSDDDLVGILTAGDDLVCLECEDYAEGSPYDIDDVEMPLHPNCRCAVYPWSDQRYAGDAAAFNDTASPLYVARPLLNSEQLRAWARAVGFTSVIPDFHVTVLYSRQPLDWDKIPPATDQLSVPGSQCLVLPELLGAGAVVMQLTSPTLQHRHEAFIRAGASHDYDEYTPHLTLTYNVPAGLDLAQLPSFHGILLFGPEQYEAINAGRPWSPPAELMLDADADWDESKHPRGGAANPGQFAAAGGGAAPTKAKALGKGVTLGAIEHIGSSALQFHYAGGHEKFRPSENEAEHHQRVNDILTGHPPKDTQFIKYRVEVKGLANEIGKSFTYPGGGLKRQELKLKVGQTFMAQGEKYVKMGQHDKADAVFEKAEALGYSYKVAAAKGWSGPGANKPWGGPSTAAPASATAAK